MPLCCFSVIEVDPCSENNGGCNERADCVKTGPGQVRRLFTSVITTDWYLAYTLTNVRSLTGVTDSSCYFQAGCICKLGYNGNGRYCYPVNLCRTVSWCQRTHDRLSVLYTSIWSGSCFQANGGCDRNAWCEYSGPGERTCKCRINFIGDGLTCKGSVFYVSLVISRQVCSH